MQLPVTRAGGNVPPMKNPLPPLRAPTLQVGFTILELMITVAVLAILLGIGVPSFQAIIRQNRLSAHTNELLSAAAIARSEAVKRGSPVTMCPAEGDACLGDDEWSNGWIVFVDENGDPGEVDGGDIIIQRWSASSADQVAITNDDTLFITYLGSGATDLADAETVFTVAPERNCTDPDGARAVTVTRVGRAGSARTNCPG